MDILKHTHGERLRRFTYVYKPLFLLQLEAGDCERVLTEAYMRFLWERCHDVRRVTGAEYAWAAVPFGLPQKLNGRRLEEEIGDD